MHVRITIELWTGGQPKLFYIWYKAFRKILKYYFEDIKINSFENKRFANSVVLN